MRIQTFVDWFIRSGYVCDWQSDRDADFISYPDRAALETWHERNGSLHHQIG
jgi:hypothetical protein